MSAIYIDSTTITTKEGLYDFLAEIFETDGVSYFSHNLDSLEEIIHDMGYVVHISHLGEFVQHFYTIPGYETGEFVRIFLDICHIPVPECIEFGHNIGQYAGYKTQVYAAFFWEITHADQIETLVELKCWSERVQIPLLIIGGGTNMLFAHSFYPGIVVKNSLYSWQYDSNTKILSAYSAESIWQIAQALEQTHAMPLWHRFIGLPGTIGGAIVGNAGCFGLETSSNFLDATVCHLQTGEITTLDKQAMQFAYRHSFLKDHPEYFLVSARFDLSEKREKYHSDEDNIAFREHKQPKGYSCGSFFKNPVSQNPDERAPSAGMLIEQSGLKGYRHGGAHWSEKHANFLLSDGETCRAEDLVELVRLTQKTVQEKTGYYLVNEVRIIE